MLVEDNATDLAAEAATVQRTGEKLVSNYSRSPGSITTVVLGNLRMAILRLEAAKSAAEMVIAAHKAEVI